MNKSIEKQSVSFLKRLLQILLITIGIALLGLLIHGANTWCNYVELFNITEINIIGNSILSNQEILRLANVHTDTSLRSINIQAVQERLESNPYVKAAAVSRELPNRLNILISERIPICYINHNSLFLLDKDGIILPIPDQAIGTNLPVISGFENDSVDYHPGFYVPNQNILNIVETISKTLITMPDLFSEISEIHYWKDDNCILYTVKGGTPIFFGKKKLSEQLDILAHFQNRLQGKRNLSDYQYLDLRWEKQIVAKERRS